MNKIFFINPPSPDGIPVIRDAHRSGRRSKEGMIWPQTNLAQLAAMVDDFLKPKIYDCIADNISFKKLNRILRKHKPEYVVLQIIPATYTNDLRVAHIAKMYGATTIAIGVQAISNPKKLLSDCFALNFAIYGEAEVTMRELLYNFVRSDGLENKKKVTWVKGLAYYIFGQYFETDPRPLTELWKFPLPRYDLLPIKKYRMPFLGNYMFVVASRGCPFNCIFCREKVVFKNEYRTQSVERLVEEVRMLKKKGVNNFLFHSGDFTANKRWVREFCESIYPLDIKWACNTHLQTIDVEMAEWMKLAGCWMVAPGIESGSDKILHTIRKGLTRDTIRKKVNMLDRAGIEVWGYFMIGLPGETKETMEGIINLACELPLSIAHFGIATPYQGTEFYNMCVENGWLRVSKWEDYDQNKTACVEYPNLSKEDIYRGVRKAYKKFYLRPKYIKKILSEAMRTDTDTVFRIVRGLLK